MSSQPLAQQELLQAPQPRRLIVPRGSGGWWGVDVSVSRVAIAYATPEGRRGARTVAFARLDGGARLAHIWAETARFVSGLLADADSWPLPGIVMVEQPSGAQPNPALSYAVGVVIGAVHAAVEADYGYEVRVETCTSSWWKKRACGAGNIYKPTRKQLGHTPEFSDYGVARWAAANGYRGYSWDEADALGIAEAARREVALDER